MVVAVDILVPKMEGNAAGGVELSALKRGGAEQQSSEDDAHNEAQAPAAPPARRSPRGLWLWVAQYDALSRKTLLQLWGSPGSVLAFILTPVVLLVFLFGVRTVLIDSSISAPARYLPAAPSDPAAALTPRRCAIFDHVRVRDGGRMVCNCGSRVCVTCVWCVWRV